MSNYFVICALSLAYFLLGNLKLPPDLITRDHKYQLSFQITLFKAVTFERSSPLPGKKWTASATLRFFLMDSRPSKMKIQNLKKVQTKNLFSVWNQGLSQSKAHMTVSQLLPKTWSRFHWNHLNKGQQLSTIKRWGLLGKTFVRITNSSKLKLLMKLTPLLLVVCSWISLDSNRIRVGEIGLLAICQRLECKVGLKLLLNWLSIIQSYGDKPIPFPEEFRESSQLL
jgi:hypothetical protein